MATCPRCNCYPCLCDNTMSTWGHAWNNNPAAVAAKAILTEEEKKAEAKAKRAHKQRKKCKRHKQTGCNVVGC